MSEERRFKHWAYLNEEGMKTWANVFPNKTVPVLSMIPMYGSLGSKDSKPQYYFLIYLPELTKKQTEKILIILSEKFNVNKNLLQNEIQKIGLPLRQSLTSGSGTNHVGLFL